MCPETRRTTRNSWCRVSTLRRFAGSMMDLSEIGRLTSVLVKHAREAFVNQQTIDEQWRSLNFTAPPDLSRALEESERFLEIIHLSGATLHFLPADKSVTLDSIYTRDASVVSPRG